jgi:hypothetical protein
MKSVDDIITALLMIVQGKQRESPRGVKNNDVRNPQRRVQMNQRRRRGGSKRKMTL